MIEPILKLPRKTKQALMLFFDVIAIIICLFSAFPCALGYWLLPN